MRRDIYLRLRGAMLERLIDRALDSGAAISSMRRADTHTLIVLCDIKSADIISDLCRKYKIDIKTLHTRGLYAVLRHIKARWTLFPALAAALIAMLCFFSRIWMIDITFTGINAAGGNALELYAMLVDAGVRPGISAADINTDAIEKHLVAETGNYSFIGIRRQGIRLLVEASPELPSPELYDIAGARDLVAARDGVIDRIEVFSGTACVNAGDTVRRGQILILGEEQKSTEEATAVSALGEVYARCWYEGHASVPRNTVLHVRTGKTRIDRALRLFYRRIPLKKSEAFASEDCEISVLPLVGLYLPVEIETCTYHETQFRGISVDENTALRHMESLARADALSKIDIPGNQYSVITSWLEKNTDSRTIGVRAVYEISTDIAVSRDALAKEDY